MQQQVGLHRQYKVGLHPSNIEQSREKFVTAAVTYCSCVSYGTAITDIRKCITNRQLDAYCVLLLCLAAQISTIKQFVDGAATWLRLAQSCFSRVLHYRHMRHAWAKNVVQRNRVNRQLVFNLAHTRIHQKNEDREQTSVRRLLQFPIALVSSVTTRRVMCRMFCW